MKTICVYGTVYNNARFVEASLRSVYRPGYRLVVVDSYSTDGTWEKLLELRKEFNLELYRYKCTRGMGRHIALSKCPEGSLTAYFDLDTVYFEDFHRVIEATEAYGSIATYGLVVVNREEALRRGGWNDLLAGEDTDFAVRMSPKAFVPIVVGENAELNRWGYTREKRYASGLRSFNRVLRAHLDFSRGIGLDLYHILALRSKRLIALSPFIIPFLAFRRPYKHCGRMLNTTCENIMRLTRCMRPETVGADRDKVFLAVDKFAIEAVGGEHHVDSVVLAKLGDPIIKVKAARSNYIVTVYLRNPWILLHFPNILPHIAKAERL